MKYFEYGKENNELMVILHGSGVSYTGAIPVAEYMAKLYHVILVSYDGFNPTEPNTTFKSVDYEAKMLAKYVNENYGGKIDILYGLSYGCAVLMSALARSDLKIVTAIADGMDTTDYSKIKSDRGKDVFCFFFTGFFYQMMGKAGPVRKKLLAKITKRNIDEADRLLYQKASWESWKNQDKCMLGKKKDYSVFGKTDMYVWYGSEGVAEKKLAKNMDKIKKTGCLFTYKVFKGLGHGGLVAEHTPRFAKEVQAAHAKTLAKAAK